MKTDKCQNKNKGKTHDKGKDKKSPAKPRKVAGKLRGYKLAEKSLSGEGSRLGGEVYGVREGAGKYGSSEETPQKRQDSTRPLDSTRYLETAKGIKTYSIKALIEKNPVIDWRYYAFT